MQRPRYATLDFRKIPDVDEPAWRLLRPHGHTYTDQVTATDMGRFNVSWNDGIRGNAKKLERFKGFVEFSRNKKWIAEDLAEDVDATVGSQVTVPKTPVMCDNLMLVCHECHQKIGAAVDGGRYLVSLLQHMQLEHERRIELVTTPDWTRKSRILYGANIGEHSAPLNFAGAATPCSRTVIRPLVMQSILRSSLVRRRP